MQLINVNNSWKEYFNKHNEDPNFYACRANISATVTFENYTVSIEISDSEDNVVIAIDTNKFSLNIIQPELEEAETRWTEQNFKELTYPIIFNEPGMSVQLNNHGTENWYEFILYPKDEGDKIACICVREVDFDFALIDFAAASKKISHG